MAAPDPVHHTCDVAVVGAGLAGLASGVHAAQQGLSVRICEKLSDARHVCNSRLTGGIFHVAHDTVLDPPEVIAARVRAVTDDTADPALVDAIATDALRLVRWLQELGVRFIRSGRDPWQTHTLSPPSLRQLGQRWQNRAGDVMLRTLEGHLARLDGQVLRGHRAERLLSRDGRCVGLGGTTVDGVPFTVDAHAVVIADGGFQANLAELARHISPDPSRLRQRNAQTGFGDGMRMAQQAGAALTELGAFYGHTLSRDALHNELLWPWPWADDLACASIVVGPDARRFVDEGHGGVYIANLVARLADPASAVIVFDHAVWEGPGRLRALSANPYMERAGGTVHRAATLDELAARAGLPADALRTEVQAYNAALDERSLQTLAPPRSDYKFAPWPIRQAPFYAVPIVAGITYTMGGIRIDGHARVLTTGGTPIPGLYAAGSATGGLDGGPRIGYVGALVFAGVTGRRASAHAAAEIHALRRAMPGSATQVAA